MPTAILAPKPRAKRKPYPRPFAELPKRVQELAVEKWQNDPDNSWPRWDDVDFLTESLVNDLEYEFAIKVATRAESYIGHDNQKRTIKRPELYWGTYRHEVEFKVDSLDWEKFLTHGVEGCEYFDEDIARIHELAAVADIVGAAFGVSICWNCRLTTDSRLDIYDRASWDIDGDNRQLTIEECAAIQAIADEIDKLLGEVYDTACARLYEIIESEIDYHNSDECIREDLENNEHFEFDEEGELV